MALIKCTECENDVSDKATACPKCGAPIKIEEKHKVEEPINKEESKIVPLQQTKTKSSPWKIITPLIILLLVFVVFVVIKNNPNSIPGIKLEINTPKPIVVTSRSDNSKSGLLKLKTTVYTTVQNQGGDGKVLVVFNVEQGGNHYDRTKSIYLKANESQDLDETFDEVKLLDGQITYSVTTRSE